MAVQGERIGGGCILITGIDGARYALRQQAITVVFDADECRDEAVLQLHGGHVVRVPSSLDEVLAWFCVETAWEAAVVPFYAARVSDLGPRDFVHVECACGHIERLTPAMLTTAGIRRDAKVQGLGSRMRCRECFEKGRAVISIRWAAG